ncbi:LysR family transcriptional regulator [Arsenophonus sp. aPb]|uniref:LysR family transcriptional regulator n=1 Tax=Arsenophonus sp. aPb TaxID=3041619 RepID=UPI00246993D5|nr:LysR family transcriptional regulator [Arsenophonus sp. aPb]WGL97971.1 LysR family transcriptional regulator [Arsenophonus sp. aPb]
MKSVLNSLPVFVAAAEANSFSQTAEKLHLTRSSVAKKIAQLEARLGITLFHRTTRTQSLTEEGTLYYEYCRRALDEIEKIEDILNSGKLETCGKFRLSMPVLFGHLCIAPLLISLIKQYPKLELEMSFNDRIIDLIEEGIDLSIYIGTLPDSSNLVARKIGKHRMTICASPSYLAQMGEPHTIIELAQHFAVAYSHSNRIQKWRLKDDNGGIYEFRPKTRLMMDDMQAIKDAIISDAGIAWLPDWLVRKELIDGRLKEIMPHAGEITFSIYAVWPKTPYLSRKVRLIVDTLVNDLPAYMEKIAAPN